MEDVVRRITRDQLVEGDPTPGMLREEAVNVPGLWSGLVSTEPGVMSGWHHHGEHDTAVYVLDGGLRVESGPEGGSVVEARPGDFVLIPAHAVHREGNPADSTAHLVVTRAGTGPVTVNVDGPG